jgi:L-rhamnose mutarotase
MLRKLANLESKRKWVEVANKINSLYPDKQRTSKQCREKFINHVQYGSGTDSMKWT